MKRSLVFGAGLLLLGPVSALAAAHPMFIVNSLRRAAWARMKADYEARPGSPSTLGGIYFGLIKRNAECACRYGDTGNWASLMYQMTGDPRYVALAWSMIGKTFLTKPDAELKGNFSREHFTAFTLWYDWLYSGLTPAQRTQYLNKLNVMARNVVTNPWSPTFPIRSGDSDQMTGDYFGLAMLYLASKDENPSIVEIWSRPFVGGFTATGTTGTFRNVIRAYATLARGGEWIESSDYNMGTTKLLVLGHEAVRTARGTDDFPEITALLPDLALRQVHMSTPDLQQVYQWGDEEHARDLRLFYRTETAMALAGLTQGVPAGRYVQDLVYRLVEKYGATGSGSAEPWGRGFLVWNPYASRERLDALSPSHWAAGMGQLLHRTGWSRDDRLFAAHFPPFQPTDHMPMYFGEFQLYRRGEWAITHPLGYAGPPLDGRGTNGMVIGGLPFATWTFREFKEVVARETSAAFAYVAGTTGGQVGEAGSWNPPPIFLHEWTRSLVYLPGSVDAIVVYDRVNATDPRPNLSSYHKDAQPYMAAIPAIKQWFVHAPERPRLDTAGADWSTGRQRVRLDTLLPRDAKAVVEDEKGIWDPKAFGAGYLKDSEKKWHVRVTPPVEQQWDTFLNVLQAHDGSEGKAVLVRSAAGEAEGVLLERDGENALLLFNGQRDKDLPQSPGTYLPAVAAQLRAAHWRRSGLEVRFPSTRTVRALVFDLTPGYAWTYQVGEGPQSPLNVSSAGVGQVVLPAGTGGRLLVRPVGKKTPSNTDPSASN